MFNIFFKFIFMLCLLSTNALSMEVISLKSSDWRSLAFNKIPANRVSFTDGSITIEVNKSASPLVHALPTPQKIKGFKVKGRVEGKLHSPTQGFEEDSFLRFGLILTGSKTLNRVQRLFAASWVKLLFEMAPKDRGLEKISFFNLTDQSARLSSFRIHPSSELMEEYVHTLIQPDGEFTMVHEFEDETEIAGIWISSDGDDTQSSFTTTLDLIEFHP